jgi:glycosyltransferase involved in cell wall biosynthesis
MHILHVTLGFYPAQNWGGPVKIVHQYSRELVRRGHKVTIYCTNLLNKKQKIKPGTFEQNIDGIRVVYFETKNFVWWPGTLGPFWMPNLSSYLKKEIRDYDVIHLNGYRGWMLSETARAAYRADIPIVTQPHGTLPVISNTLLLKRMYDFVFEKRELGNISALIALQESEKRQAISRGIPSGIIDVIPNGIDVNELDELPESGIFRKKMNIWNDQPLILFLGRINKIKGVDLLIDAFALLDIPDARLVIAGPDDGQLSEILDKIRQYKIEQKVILPGLLTGDWVKAALLDANLFVLPSRFDAYPTTIMEACLMGVPMVITDRCAISDLVKDRVAEVVPFDVQAFYKAMRLLLTDQKKYNLYKANCQTVVNENFSIKVAVNRLEAVYKRVIDEKVNR